ncbi:MAG: hypothetical protein K6T75_00655 [Acetobacteraceae bacterium]|nr:hypothetical protein [Acetobacteraceae bacterium]
MRNPFAGLHPALELINREGKVLPATGQAMEDLVRPDHQEVIDTLRMGEDRLLDVVLEAPNRRPYVTLRPLHRNEHHMLRYFLDGSARTYFLGDVVEGRRRTSVHVAQIGAAVVFRLDDGRVKVAGFERQIVLMMDKKAVSFGERVAQLVQEAGGPYRFCDIMEEDGESEMTSPGKEPRSRAAHKAHHMMAKLEDALGRNLAREPGHWLVLDGSLGKDLHAWRNVPHFFGVTKSFSREPTFTLPGGGARQVVNLYELLAGLPHSARTCAFSVRSGQMAVWYVRLREQRHLDYPLMGVVKVEFPNPTREAVPSELIDEISAVLVAERHVTPHGKDPRWHAHLYAIHLAEQAVKNAFISSEALRAGLRWPAFPARAQQ